MPRWLRVVRGMIGTGLTFATGVATVAGGVAWLAGAVPGGGILRIAGRLSVAGFLLGVAFGGILAITARGRRLNKLWLRLVGVLGAGVGVGVLYWVFLASTGGRVWSLRNAIANFVILTVMGAGSAVATLMIAKRARSALESGDALHGVGAGDEEINRNRRAR